MAKGQACNQHLPFSHHEADSHHSRWPTNDGKGQQSRQCFGEMAGSRIHDGIPTQYGVHQINKTENHTHNQTEDLYGSGVRTQLFVINKDNKV